MAKAQMWVGPIVRAKARTYSKTTTSNARLLQERGLLGGHIATICVGLLIAILLEQTVEALHRAHERRDLLWQELIY